MFHPLDKRVYHLFDKKLKLRNPGKTPFAANTIRLLSSTSSPDAELFICRDIYILICNVITPSNYVINKWFYKYLRLLRNETFYSCGNASRAIKKLCRAAIVLKKSNMFNNELLDILQVLQTILFGFQYFNVRVDKQSITSVFKTLELLLNFKNGAEPCFDKFLAWDLDASVVLLASQLHLMAMDLMPSYYNIGQMTSFYCLKIIQYFMTLEPTNVILYNITLKLTKRIIRQLYHMSNKRGDCECCLSQIVSFIQDYIIPSAKPFTIVNVTRNPSRFIYLLETFIFILGLRNARRNAKLVSAIFGNHIFKLVMTIIYHSPINRKVRSLSWKFLFQSVTVVLKQYFTFPDDWKKGYYHIKKQVLEGMNYLSVSDCNWLNILSNPMGAKSHKNAASSLIYLSIITEYSWPPIPLDGAYEVIMTYFTSIVNVHSERLYTKISWVILAYLENTEGIAVVDSSLRQTAITKLESELNSLKNCELLFTNHPMLLLHAFQWRGTDLVLKKHSLRSWLMSNPPDLGDYGILERLLRENPDTWYIAVDILETGCEESVASALLESLQSFILHAKAVNVNVIGPYVWRKLTCALESHSNCSTMPGGLEQLMELAIIVPPPEVNECVMALASILLSLINSLAGKVTIPHTVVKIVHKILVLSGQLSDYRVPQLYLENKIFLQSLLNGISSSKEVPTVSLLLKITALLSKMALAESLQVQTVGKLNIYNLLKRMMLPDEHVVKGCLLLLLSIFESDWKTPLCTVHPPMNDAILRRIFWMLLNSCLLYRNIAETWECLTYCLDMSSHKGQIVQHYLQQQSVISLLKRAIHNPPAHTLPAIAQFFSIWIRLSSQFSNNEPWPSRRIAPPIKVTSFNIILEALLKDEFKEHRKQLFTELKAYKGELDDELFNKVELVLKKRRVRNIHKNVSP